MSEKITVEVTVNAPIETVWEKWNNARDIEKWNAASDDWHTPKAENTLAVGQYLISRMEAKDGSFGFDFKVKYTQIDEHKFISYEMEDGRKASITFSTSNNQTHISETFDAETENPIDMQQFGWQAILNNFKKYVEALG